METPQTSAAPQQPNPPTTMDQNPPRSKMVAPAKKAYIKALRPIRLTGDRALTEGMVAEVSEKDAKEFADKKFDNAYPYSGERVEKSPDAQKGTISRAVRISEAEFKEASKKPASEDAEQSA